MTTVWPPRDQRQSSPARLSCPGPAPCSANHSAAARCCSGRLPTCRPVMRGSDRFAELAGKITPSASRAIRPAGVSSRPSGLRGSMRISRRAGQARRWTKARRIPGRLASRPASPGASRAHKGTSGRGKRRRTRCSWAESAAPVIWTSPRHSQPGAAQKPSRRAMPAVRTRPRRRLALREALTFTGSPPRARGRAPRDASGCRGIPRHGPSPSQSGDSCRLRSPHRC